MVVSRDETERLTSRHEEKTVTTTTTKPAAPPTEPAKPAKAAAPAKKTTTRKAPRKATAANPAPVTVRHVAPTKAKTTKAAPVPVALVAAVGIRLVLGLAHRVLPLLRERVLEVTTLVGLGVGACAALYALLADRSPDEVAMSGQMTLPVLVAEPQAWAASALVLVLLFKGVAYALSLAAFRGGAIFPAVFLGAALGVLVADLPGFGSGPAIAAGMAAATAAVMRLPIASILIVTLLLGAPVAAMLPVVLLATVIGVLAVELPVRLRAGGSSG